MKKFAFFALTLICALCLGAIAQERQRTREEILADIERLERSRQGEQIQRQQSSSEPNILIDSRDGQRYRTVKIGDLTWMGQNLNFANPTRGRSWCYNDNASNCAVYGRLYDLKAALSACPVGWRLPGGDDWEHLIQAAGGIDVAGRKLRSRTGWGSSGNGTDEFGFAALPGRYSDEKLRSYNDLERGNWWIADENERENESIVSAYSWAVLSDSKFESNSGFSDFARELGGSWSNGFSVRCVLHDNHKLRIFTPSTYQRQRVAPKTPVSIKATPKSSYEFVNWTATSGQVRFANANSAATTVTLSSDATVIANFRYVPPPPGKQFNPNIQYASFVDSRDRQSYRTVKIGNRTWMAQNLNYAADGSLCYDDRTPNCATFGRLYSLTAARIACPAGWRLPDNEDWEVLLRAVGGQRDKSQNREMIDGYYDVAGEKLKSKIGWSGGNVYDPQQNKVVWRDGNGTDEFGFSAIPGGQRTHEFDSDDARCRFLYSNIGRVNSWWSTEGVYTVISDNNQVYITTDIGSDCGDGSITSNRSIRCILDDGTRTLLIIPNSGGTVIPEFQQTVALKTPFSIKATPQNDHEFVGWKVTSGQAQLDDANSATTTVILSTSATITANFQDTTAAARAERERQKIGSRRPPVRRR